VNQEPGVKESAVANMGKGVAAGFAATVVLSALMLMKSALGVMPELDLPRMLGRMMGGGAGVRCSIHIFQAELSG
jgi:hypothetical protein